MTSYVSKERAQEARRAKVVLRELTIVNFKLRYQGSLFGYVWALLRPLLLFMIIYLVFTRFFDIGRNVEHYPVYLLLGTTIWNFFSEMTNSSIKSVVGKGNLIRKLNFPKTTIPMSSVTSAAINTMFSMVIVIFFVLVTGVQIRWVAPLVILPIFQVLILGSGLSFFLSALYVRFRDVDNIWSVVIQAGFYLTPIIYPLTIIDSVGYRQILLLNPMAQAIQDARWLLISSDVDTIGDVYGSQGWRALPLALTLVIFMGGYLFFRRLSPSFAEEV